MKGVYLDALVERSDIAGRKEAFQPLDMGLAMARRNESLGEIAADGLRLRPGGSRRLLYRPGPW
jgi:hypothetical protein